LRGLLVVASIADTARQALDASHTAINGVVVSERPAAVETGLETDTAPSVVVLAVSVGKP